MVQDLFRVVQKHGGPGHDLQVIDDGSHIDTGIGGIEHDTAISGVYRQTNLVLGIGRGDGILDLENVGLGKRSDNTAGNQGIHINGGFGGPGRRRSSDIGIATPGNIHGKRRQVGGVQGGIERFHTAWHPERDSQGGIARRVRAASTQQGGDTGHFPEHEIVPHAQISTRHGKQYIGVVSQNLDLFDTRPFITAKDVSVYVVADGQGRLTGKVEIEFSIDDTASEIL